MRGGIPKVVWLLLFKVIVLRKDWGGNYTFICNTIHLSYR